MLFCCYYCCFRSSRWWCGGGAATIDTGNVYATVIVVLEVVVAMK